MPTRKHRPDSMPALGAVIRSARAKLGISQLELAARTKLHVNYIGGIERAERNVTILSLARVAEGLETKAWKLLKEADI